VRAPGTKWTWSPTRGWRPGPGVAQDKKGDIAVGFTVSNGSSVFPDIRYTGRLKGDELNHLPGHPVRKPALSTLGVTAIACLWKV
jgi:hypothetical protein